MSGQVYETEIDLSSVNGDDAGDAGVGHGALLLAFVEAVMGDDEAGLPGVRKRLLEALGPRAFVDACAVIGAFNVVDRIADSTGIPLDPRLEEMSGSVREDLDLARFASSANTFPSDRGSMGDRSE